MADAFRDEFEATGYCGPVRVFDPSECRSILRLVHAAPPAVDWFKGKGASSRALYELATHPLLLQHVAELIGENVMLWGASVIRRPPGFVHPWHTDIESSVETGHTVSAWIGLSNTTRESSLRVVSGSHRAGQSVQQRAMAAGKSRDEITSEDVLGWAREEEPTSRLVQLSAQNGDAVFFHGRLWHGSHNSSRRHVRTAVLLQYATPDTPIRIPDFRDFEWPFHFLEHPLPPCIMVRGTGHQSGNRIVNPPTIERGSQPSLTTRIRVPELPLDEDQEVGWKPYPIFRGQTNCLTDLSCHISVLSAGTTPHEPHRHPEEELLVMLHGSADLVIARSDVDDTLTTQPLDTGSFVYYRGDHLHTIRNSGTEPATYLMFKWKGDRTEPNRSPLNTSVYRYGETLSELAVEEGFSSRRIFEGPTAYLRKLHAHVSTLSPGAGYPPHTDAYDVAILVRSGTIETLGRRVGANGVIFYSAGEPHGIKNVGSQPASYLVFEFHGHRTVPEPASVMKRFNGFISTRAKRAARRLLPGSIRRAAKKWLR